MVRTNQDDDHIAELALSIAKHGLLQPVIVTPADDGNYQLQAGFHRLLAAKRLQWKTIPALIRQDDTGSTKNIAFVENLLRKDMTLEEEAEAVNYLATTENLSISSICDAIGKSVAWVQKRLMLPNLPPEVRDELFEGRISIGHAEVIARIEEPSLRAIIINCIHQQGLTVREAENLAKIYSDNPTITDAIDAGLQEAQEIQAQRKGPQAPCHICSRKTDLIKMTLLHLCPDCVNWIQDLSKTPQKKEAHHGKRTK